MSQPAKIALEQTLYLWSVVHNCVLSYPLQAIIGRSVEPFTNDQYLDREHFIIKFDNGAWKLVCKETTNGTRVNDEVLNAGETRKLELFDVLLGGDQVLVVLGRELVDVTERDTFLKRIKLSGEKTTEQAKLIQNRSVTFFKLDYPNFLNMIKRTEIERKIEIALAKKAHDLKPFNDRISQLQAKHQKISQAWDSKIDEFKQAIARIKDET